jgi:hypothetical protein
MTKEKTDISSFAVFVIYCFNKVIRWVEFRFKCY